MTMRHDKDSIFRHATVELIFFLKKSVTNLGTKLYNKLPNHIKGLENLKLFTTSHPLFSGRILITWVRYKF